MFKRKNEELTDEEKGVISPIPQNTFHENIVYIDAINTYRVLWLEPNHIEEHNHKYFIPAKRLGWYSKVRTGRYTASLTKIDGVLEVNPHGFTVKPNTDYALQNPDHWVEVTLVYEQELPFDD